LNNEENKNENAKRNFSQRKEHQITVAGGEELKIKRPVIIKN